MVQHRYRETILRSFDPSTRLRTQDRPFDGAFRQAQDRLRLGCPRWCHLLAGIHAFAIGSQTTDFGDDLTTKKLNSITTRKFFLTSSFLIFLILKQVQHRPQFLEGQLNPFCNDSDKQWRIKVLLYNLLIVNECIRERIYVFPTEKSKDLPKVEISLNQ